MLTGTKPDKAFIQVRTEFMLRKYGRPVLYLKSGVRFKALLGIK